jgi:hypothetical protein
VNLSIPKFLPGHVAKCTNRNRHEVRRNKTCVDMMT